MIVSHIADLALTVVAGGETANDWTTDGLRISSQKTQQQVARLWALAVSSPLLSSLHQNPQLKPSHHMVTHTKEVVIGKLWKFFDK